MQDYQMLKGILNSFYGATAAPKKRLCSVDPRTGEVRVIAAVTEVSVDITVKEANNND